MYISGDLLLDCVPISLPEQNTSPSFGVIGAINDIFLVSVPEGGFCPNNTELVHNKTLIKRLITYSLLTLIGKQFRNFNTLLF
jgi:hypothetical protein